MAKLRQKRREITKKKTYIYLEYLFFYQVDRVLSHGDSQSATNLMTDKIPDILIYF